jgi:hypothetical protein
MARRTIAAVLGLALISVCSRHVRAEAPLTIRIRIYDAPGIPIERMNRSETRVVAIFHRVGIQVVWRDCRRSATPVAACGDAPESTEALVRLVAGPPVASIHACGMALLPATGTAHYITIFVDCIRDAVDTLRTPEEILLAGAIAHEIGHLLLGPAHSPVGLMQASPRPIDWTRAAFTDREAQQMRYALIEGEAR